MSPESSKSTKLWVACGVIAAAGAAIGWWQYDARERSLRATLLEDARRSALVFDGLDFGSLQGAAADSALPGYTAVVKRLQKFRSLTPDTYFVALVRVVPGAEGTRVLVSDGVAADEATATASTTSAAELQRAAEGHPASVGPFRGPGGLRLSHYVVVTPRTPVANARYLLRMDTDVSAWRGALWRAAFEGAFYTWFVLGLPLVAWFVSRRQVQQRHVIRNLSEAVEQSHSAIGIIGVDGAIAFANRGLCEQLGYSRSELIGRNWRQFPAPETPPEVFEAIVAAARAGKPWEGEWLNRRQNSSVYPVRGVITPVRGRDGKLACYAIAFDDVTEAKEREAELREARDLAQAADRAKGHFLATMSHEVRTPLNGIVGFSSLLLDTPLTPEQREYVQTIRMSTEALIQLTGDILDFARIESGKLKLDPLACDPRECVEDVLDMLAPKCDGKGIELLHSFGEDVPAAVVTDGGRLRQVLSNLIGNAVKFTERGEVEVTVRRLPAASSVATSASSVETCVLEFVVRDTGIGIAPEHHAKLFRAFSQVDDSTTRRYSGTGLGLAICRDLVEMMGGTIGLESAPGRGTSVRFTIRAPVAARTAVSKNLSGLKLGVVMGSGSLRNELTTLVQRWGGRVVEAARPEDYATAAVDVVLVDVTDDAARELSARPPPLFGLTSDRLLGLVPITLASGLRSSLRAHFRLLVNKPVHHESFYALLAGSVGHVPIAAPLAQFGFRCLIVEDNVLNRRMVEQMLKGLGCSATSTDNGRTALELLTQRPDDFDVILLDLHMPELDGLATLREMRLGAAGPAAQTIWVIALTADARDEQRARAQEAGTNDYLTKPLQPHQLEAALRRFRNERATRKR